MTTATRKPENGNENAFVRDLALAQAEMENAAYNKVNPHFKSRYADLASVREASLAILNKYGFALIQTRDVVGWDDAGAPRRVLRTELAHKSGESRISVSPLINGTAQQMGSDLTYNRRYDWSSIAGIASEDDDDANEAMNAGIAQKSAYQVRADKDYETLLAEMNACQTRNELFEWRKSIMSRRAALPDSWRELLDEQSELRRLNMIDVEKEKV